MKYIKYFETRYTIDNIDKSLSIKGSTNQKIIKIPQK